MEILASVPLAFLLFPQQIAERVVAHAAYVVHLRPFALDKTLTNIVVMPVSYVL
jgi:hypothetical protein